jgi:hypothetical protein
MRFCGFRALISYCRGCKKRHHEHLRSQRDPFLNQDLLSAQSVKILEDLMAVLMRSEQCFIRGDQPLSAQSIPAGTREEEVRTRGQSTDIHTLSKSAASQPDDASSMTLPDRSLNLQDNWVLEQSITSDLDSFSVDCLGAPASGKRTPEMKHLTERTAQSVPDSKSPPSAGLAAIRAEPYSTCFPWIRLLELCGQG